MTDQVDNLINEMLSTCRTVLTMPELTLDANAMAWKLIELKQWINAEREERQDV